MCEFQMLAARFLLLDFTSYAVLSTACLVCDESMAFRFCLPGSRQSIGIFKCRNCSVGYCVRFGILPVDEGCGSPSDTLRNE